MKPTYLYIKQHSVTKLKYFGKTTKSDPVSYLGSGKHWVSHIKKHGVEHVVTLWHQLFTDEKELIDYASKFSQDNNIVSSSEWANLREENGLDGGGWPIGYKHKEESNEINRQKAIQRHKEGRYDYEKLRQSRIGFKQPQSQKDAVSKFNSATWTIISPIGQVMTITNLLAFCKEHSLDQGNLSRGKHKGWRATKVS